MHTSGSGSAHSSRTAENVLKMKLDKRITQFFVKENPSGWFQYFKSLGFHHELRSDK